MDENALAGVAIGAAIEVHKALGPGLLESAYQDCLLHELTLRGVAFESEVPLAIDYKGLVVGEAYRADVIVDGRLILELKAIAQVAELHKAQLLTYLRLSKCKLGLLINFNTALMKNGIFRVVNKL